MPNIVSPVLFRPESKEMDCAMPRGRSRTLLNSCAHLIGRADQANPISSHVTSPLRFPSPNQSLHNFLFLLRRARRNGSSSSPLFSHGDRPPASLRQTPLRFLLDQIFLQEAFLSRRPRLCHSSSQGRHVKLAIFLSWTRNLINQH